MDILRKIAFEDIWTKLGALLLAVVVWNYLDSISMESRDGRIRVAPIATSEDTVIISVTDGEGRPIPDLIDVTLQGPKGEVQKVQFHELVCEPEVSLDDDEEEKELIVQIKSTDLNMPSDIRLSKVNPESLRVRVARRATRSVPINVENLESLISGRVADGFAVTRVEVEPTSIEISGPAGALEALNTIPLAPIVVNGESKSFSRTGRIPATINGVPVNAESRFIIRVTVEPDVEVVERNVPFGINLVFPPDFAYQGQIEMDRDTVTVTLRGPKQLVDKVVDRVNGYRFRVYVDINDVAVGIKNFKPGANVDQQLMVSTTRELEEKIEWSLEPNSIGLSIPLPEKPDTPKDDGTPDNGGE
jgi:YbbR domain-containing protein